MENLSNITALHPVRDEALRELLDRAGVDLAVVETLLAEHESAEVDYGGYLFYLRRLDRRCDG